MTTRRCIELGQVAGLDLLETEALIRLAQADSDNPTVRDFMMKRNEVFRVHMANLKIEAAADAQQSDFFCRSLLLELLRGIRAMRSPKKLSDAFLVRGFLTPTEVEVALHALEKGGVVSKAGNAYSGGFGEKRLWKELPPGVEKQKYAATFHEFSRRSSQHAFQSGDLPKGVNTFAFMTDRQMKALALRLMELVQWIENDRVSPDEPRHFTQLNFNFFPVLKAEALSSIS